MSTPPLSSFAVRFRRLSRRLLSSTEAIQTVNPSPQWRRLEERLRTAERMIDLGCGAHPNPRALVGVDAFIQPEHRVLGTGDQLTAGLFRERGVKFVQAELGALPFRAGEFDFAYSHHAFEHVPDPKAACHEMMRVARSGAIVTPSVFAEFAFGRPYHLWLVLQRRNTLIFIRKLVEEDRPFGEHPEPESSGGWRATASTNPFELLLNDGAWYHGREIMPRLSRLLRGYWYSHSSIIEVVFLWEGQFDVVVIDDAGRVI